MTKLYDTATISRRKVLAGLGAVGLASAGVGVGTTAFFSDRERVRAALEAGRLDLLIDYRATYSPWGYQPVDSDGTEYPVGDSMTDPATGEDGPVYVVGMAPDFRNADGSVVDNETWTAATQGIDACVPLADQLPYDVDGDGTADVFAGDATSGGEALDNYRVDYVDGAAGMLFELFDVKPKDEGEATISLHVCDNPAYLWVRGSQDFDDENTLYEPEDEAGDTGTGPFTNGELDDFVWVRAFYDPDCSNSLGEDEPVIYEGSLAGFLDATASGLVLDPVRDADIVDTTGSDAEVSGSDDRLDVVAMPGNPKCRDFGLEQAIKIENEGDLDSLGSTTYSTPEGDVTVEITQLKDGDEGLVFDWSADFGVDRVIVKGGNAANVYVYNESTGDGGLTTVDEKGISHISFCFDDGNGDVPVDPQDEPGICFEKGAYCVAVEWYLPCFVEQDDDRGFAQLPSDAVQTDAPVNGEFPSLADEIIAEFDLDGVEDIDVNVVQSDATEFTLAFAAVQCRHNMTNANPFADASSA